MGRIARFDTIYYRQQVRELRIKNPHWTQVEIAQYLRITPATVSNYLRRYRT